MSVSVLGRAVSHRDYCSGKCEVNTEVHYESDKINYFICRVAVYLLAVFFCSERLLPKNVNFIFPAVHLKNYYMNVLLEC
jgi:hypothetical protein